MSDVYRLAVKKDRKGQITTRRTYNGEEITFFVSEKVTKLMDNYERVGIDALRNNPSISILESTIIGDSIK